VCNQCQQLFKEKYDFLLMGDSPISQNTLRAGLLGNQPEMTSFGWSVHEMPLLKGDDKITMVRLAM
jgi:hypothetical protein